MRLIQVLCMVLTQLSVGGLLFAGLLPPRALRSSFFTFHCLVSAIAAALALVLTKMVLFAAWWDVRYLGLMVIGATVAWGLFRLDNRALGRVVMLGAALAGMVLGIFPLAKSAMELRGLQTQAMWFFDAGVVSGMLLLGVTHVGMVLGHWYLIMRRLSFDYLLRFSLALLGVVALRTVVVVITLVKLDDWDPVLADQLIPHLWSAGGNFFFFAARIVLGLVLPAALGFLILKAVRAHANQSATGLLYVAEVCVLFGELFAAYLMV